MKDYQYIGKHVNRIDGNDLVSGRLQFIDDIRLPGMLYARILKSPYAHANIIHIDVAKAKALPGVKAVLTYETVPDWMCGLPHHRKVLDRRLRFVGDNVALVAAITPEIADESLKLIQVEYEELPFVLDCEDALEDDAPQIYEEFDHNEFTPGAPFSKEPFTHIQVGDVEKGFKECDYVAEGCYTYGSLPHPLPPECPCVIAQWTNPHAMTLWYNGAAPHLQKFNTEASIPCVAVRVISVHAGGSYGSKQLIPLMALQSAALAQVTKRPVKLMMDKNDHFLSYEARMGSRIRGKVGLTKDGIINAVQGMWYVDSGMSSIYAQAQMAVGLGEAQAFLGKCQNWDLDSKLIGYQPYCSRIMNGNMIDYKWRTFNEFPPFDTIVKEGQFDSESFHALGFGEISGSPAPPAILMAISNAIGVKVTHYPATPSVILKALGKIKGGK